MQTFVAVRALCEFTAKTGDLDLRFTPSATALEGMSGHVMVTSRRGSGYDTEITLKHEFEGLTVRGRADGYDRERNVLEEIKTFRGELDAMPANRRALHWAQAMTYAYLICRKLGLDSIDVSLVYYDVASQTETALVERRSVADLKIQFEDRCRRYAAWALQEAEHRIERDASLATCTFPYAGFRPGQRELSEAVYKASVAGRCLMAQAPTGIGKTVGTLFPLLKAMPKSSMDKVFYLTAKGPGRALALDAMRVIAGAGVHARVLELVARDKACEHPGKACHGEACPLAQGFFDRLPAARAELVDADATMDRETVRRVAREHAVCPYYLAQDMVHLADIIVGDYNYWFDSNAMLHGLTTVDEWKVGVLVDEAHNLVERARSMYSAALLRSDLGRVASSAPPAVKGSLARLHRVWMDLETLQVESAHPASSAGAGPYDTPETGLYAVMDAVPDSFASAMQQSISAVTDYLTEQPAAVGPESPLLRWHFDALAFSRLLESFGEHSLLELDIANRDASDSTMRLRNVVPAPFLKPRLTAAHTLTLFSATLGPSVYYSDLLGLPDDALHIDVASPFSSDQLRVEIVDAVSTRYARRATSVVPITELMARRYAEAPGNYLAFFSSFEYLHQVASLFQSLHPDVPVRLQSRSMDEAGRADFIRRFEVGGRGIGFAVLGGAFGEGIDLPGTRLTGAFIATLGLPPVNAANEQIRARMDRIFGSGYDYTYLFPGLTKVVQAAGRVIRGRDDRGSVHLIDDRYSSAVVKALLPRWWQLNEGRAHGLPARDPCTRPPAAASSSSTPAIDHLPRSDTKP